MSASFRSHWHERVIDTWSLAQEAALMRWTMLLGVGCLVLACKNETEKYRDELREAGKAAGAKALAEEPSGKLGQLIAASMQSENCPAAAPVPAKLELVKDGAYFVSGRASEWEDSGWTCRHFRIDGAQYWQYEVATSPSRVTAYARRLDGTEIVEQSWQAQKVADTWAAAAMPSETRRPH
jgi:hypothetical protein